MRLVFLFLLLSGPSLSIAAEPSNVRSEQPVRIVYIDAGHGGMNTGAVGIDGLREKDVSLDIANRMARQLKEHPRYMAVMSRTTDSFVGLRERTRLANQRGADLFLSIHVNSNPSPSRSGVEIYSLAASSHDEEAISIVLREEGEVVNGAAPIMPTSLMHGLRLAASQRVSVVFGRLCLKELVAATGARNQGLRQASFAVLKEAVMPAVVAEVGYLTNVSEAEKLQDPAYRELIATGLVEAILKWEKVVPIGSIQAARAR